LDVEYASPNLALGSETGARIDSGISTAKEFATMGNVKPVPDGYHNVTPYLYVRAAANAIDFYKNVFGAEEFVRMPGPDGRIMHAELRIGDSVVMLADENPHMGIMSPQTVGGHSGALHLYLENVDAVVEKALANGAKLLRPIKNQFYGDRSGTVLDPFGHMWSVATHVEDVSPEEMRKRMKAMSQAAGS
jgi:PhnB protein